MLRPYRCLSTMNAQVTSRTTSAATPFARARQLSISAIAALAFWLVPVLGLLYVAASSYGAITERSYSKANDFTRELTAGHSAGQTFVSRYAGLTGIELHIATSGPQAP